MWQTLRRVAVALGLVILVACGAQPSTPAVTNISVGELKQRLDQQRPMILLDVRTPEEYTNDGHVAGSQLLPLQELAAKANTLPKDQEIVCICRSGNRSKTACDQLQQLGFTKLVNVQGGMIAWGQAGLPIERP